MKFGFIFLMSALVVVTNQQYFQNHHRGLSWWSPKPTPFLNRYQQHYYDPVDAEVPYFRYAKPIKNARPVIVYSPEDADEMMSPELIGPNDPYKDIVEDNQPIYVDAQSRSKFSLPAKFDPRFFFATEATIRNPFIKTATYTLHSTVTLSSVVHCIVAGDFVDAAARERACGRKRKLLESVEKTDQQFPIVPSEPLKSETTALPYSVDLIREKRQVLQTSPWNQGGAIASSKDEDDDSQSRFLMPTSSNNKQRFLYLNSGYVASTTITSYSFESTTLTRTVDVGIDVGLNCIPTGYVVCK